MSLNLARRPFVDTRPANALTALVVVVVLGLSAASWRTLVAYVGGSRGTQAAITALRAEISRAEDQRKAGEAALAGFDVDALGLAAEDANAIARRRSFSWTRFLTRVEETLPHEVRIVSISLARSDEDAATGTASTSASADAMPLELQLVSRDPLGLPKTIRAFYASRWFDAPLPHMDEGQERAGPEGRRIALSVLYFDAARPAPVLRPAGAKAEGAARPKGSAAPRTKGGAR